MFPWDRYSGVNSVVFPSLSSLPSLRDCRGQRKSSYDRSGGNSDWVFIPHRAETKIAEIEGPGVITHIWIPFGPDPFKRIILRMYWDGESSPSVEVPLVDFFGVGLGQTLSYQSAMINVAPVGGMNCYFPMPFERSALITISHDYDEPIERLYFQVDYLALPQALRGVGYFHSQYRQSGDHSNPIKKREDGSLEHTIVQAERAGHFVGFVFSLMAAVAGSWDSVHEVLALNLDGQNEGVLDDGARASDGPEHLNPHAYDLSGRPYVMIGDDFAGRYSRYRWFLEGPPSFKRTLESSIGIRHEAISDLRIYSVGYWYQKEPHKTFPPFPLAQDRIPPLVAAKAQH